MNRYKIKNYPSLKKILWLDFFLGSSTGIAGILFAPLLREIFGLANILILSISLTTLLYSIYAYWLARRNEIPITLLRVLVNANWLWTSISIILLLQHYKSATWLGLTFIILQILVVGGLAYLEGNQIIRDV